MPTVLKVDLTVFAARAVETTFVHEVMVIAAQQDEVVETGFTAIRPVLDVVTVAGDSFRCLPQGHVVRGNVWTVFEVVAFAIANVQRHHVTISRRSRVVGMVEVRLRDFGQGVRSSGSNRGVMLFVTIHSHLQRLDD